MTINGQSYKHAASNKVRSALRSAESTQFLQVGVFRDFGQAKAAAPPVKGLSSTPRRANIRSFKNVAEIAMAATAFRRPIKESEGPASPPA